MGIPNGREVPVMGTLTPGGWQADPGVTVCSGPARDRGIAYSPALSIALCSEPMYPCEV
jgi:hypothetical protein